MHDYARRAPIGGALVPGFIDLAREIASTGSSSTAPMLRNKIAAMEARVRQHLGLKRIDAIHVRAIVDLLPTLLTARQLPCGTDQEALRKAYRRALDIAADTISRAEYNELRALGDRSVQHRAWDLLPEPYRRPVELKIGHLGKNPADALDALLGRVKVDLQNPAAVREGVMTVMNLYDGAKGVWRYITRFDGGFGEYDKGLTLVIAVRPGFLDALRHDGFQVDDVTEQAKRFEHLYKDWRDKGWTEAARRVKRGEVLNGIHKHSARKVTENTEQPGLHFVQEDTYGADRFDVHWDLHSTSCRKCTVKERIKAGGTHSDPSPASLVRTRMGRPLLCAP